MKKTSSLRNLLAPAVAFLVVALVPAVGRAQFGTGGSVGGTGTGTLADSDIYISIQKEQNVNPNDRVRDRLLNRANCQCGTPAWVRASLQPSVGTAKIAAIPTSATVSMYIGDSCDSSLTIQSCKQLAVGVPFSQFRIMGISAKTSVDVLSRTYSSGGITIGTGGASGGGSGGAGGSGGSGVVSGSGGGVGSGGAGGSGTGGASGDNSTSINTVCNRTAGTQTVWVFIGTTQDLNMQLGKASEGFRFDPEPPPPLAGIKVEPAHQALLLSWTGLSSTNVPDLLGYQAVCARGNENLQVFKDGTFPTSFDGCPTGTTATGLASLDPAYICSDLLSTSATNFRIKVLENDITYLVGVTAVDKNGNASAVTPIPLAPKLTKDFFYEYRNGSPQGGATGGFCAVSPVPSGGWTAAALAGLTMLALAFAKRRPPRGGK